MPSPYVHQVSVHTKHRDSGRIFHKDISKPSLGLDLRFEQTYLRSIAPHVRLTTPAPDENEKHGGVAHLQGQGHQLHIKWGTVIWITTRDQVLAPMFQGILWGTLSPWVQYFRGASTRSPTDDRPSKTGAGIAKLKSWLSSIIPQSTPTSFRTK